MPTDHFSIHYVCPRCGDEMMQTASRGREDGEENEAFQLRWRDKCTNCGYRVHIGLAIYGEEKIEKMEEKGQL